MNKGKIKKKHLFSHHILILFNINSFYSDRLVGTIRQKIRLQIFTLYYSTLTTHAVCLCIVLLILIKELVNFTLKHVI